MADESWIPETLFDDLGFRMTFKVERVLYEQQTSHHHLILFEQQHFGKVLMLDGATQVAEVEKYNIHTVQDYLDLAEMIERGDLVPVPAVTESYILLGVGQRANEEPFTKFEEGEDQGSITNPDEYQPLQRLAKSFNGRSFDLENPYDRHVLKINMLSTIRPQALKIIEEVAAGKRQEANRRRGEPRDTWYSHQRILGVGLPVHPECERVRSELREYVVLAPPHLTVRLVR